MREGELKRWLREYADAREHRHPDAAAVDTSTQNASYHAERLREFDLVEAVSTWYSSKGKEMTVYAPTTERLAVRFDPDARSHSHRR